ncbi:MAG: heavy metal translocating P-type ATPase [Bacilli bacterium]|nr:heavy metal translocating P-type ATPase [Bacilli bacterium]
MSHNHCHDCNHHEHNHKLELVKLIISIILFIFSFKFSEYKLLIIITSYIIISYELVIDVFKNLFKGEIFDEKFLMFIATIGAFIIGEYEEALLVMILYQLGELLNHKAVDKSRKDIIKLMNLRSDVVRVITNDKEKETSPEKVKVNDIILVNPGEKIPLDGIVVEGVSLVDTSSITGESKPLSVKKDSKVLSGTINMNGTLKIIVTETYKNSTVSKILNLIENSDKDKAETERFFSRFAKIYTPIVVCLALAIFIIPSIITKDFNTWGYRSLVFLVTSCPCALVISIPLSFFSGIGACSKNGILVKNSLCLEKLLDIDEIIFDKTGTITEGVFEVVKVKGFGIKAKELLEIAAICESNSIHPVAASIKERYGKEVDTSKLKNFKLVDGGVTVTYDNDKYILGNYNLLRKNKVNFNMTKDIGTVVYISKNNEYLGYILISDKIKKSSKKIVSELKKRGIRDLIVLSGDNDNVVKSVCKSVGISRYSSELLPQDKVAYLNAAKKEKLNVMFVGDGVNDAPALIAADLGVSMGGIGSDAALEASDMVIMNDDLAKINTAIDIASFTKKIIYQNITFVLVVKGLILILAAFGLSNMIGAIFADVGVCLITIINSLRIFRGK